MRFFSIFLVLAAAAILSGCAGYQLGPTNGLAAGSRTIEIQPFRNDTQEARFQDTVTTAVRRNINRDGTYKLATHGEPDIVVAGTITRYRRQGVSFQPRDTLTERDYNLVMFARVIAKDRATDKVIVDKEVSARTIIRVGADLPSAEREAMPILAEELARNITYLLVDGTW